MRYLLFGAVLALLTTFCPAVLTAALGLLGAAAVTVAAKPAVLSFTAGLLVGPRLARRWAR
jgi:hypothetical protein